MMEIQAKEELIDMTARPEQGEKICRKTYLVRLGVDNPRLGVDNPRLSVGACLGLEMAPLGEPKIKKKKKKNS